MLFRDIINLISIVESPDGYGGIIETEIARQVYANKKSIRQSEFYQAQMINLNPELMFEIRAIDYNREKKIAYDNNEYRIIRTYTKNDEIIELICSRWI